MLTGLPTPLSTAPIESTLLTIDGAHLALALAVAAAAVAAGVLAHRARTPRRALPALTVSGRGAGDERDAAARWVERERHSWRATTRPTRVAMTIAR